MRPSAIVDFDGTICDYNGFKGEGVFGPLKHAALSTLKRMKNENWHIVVFTSRNWVEQEAIEDYLREHGVPFDQVVCGKPIGAVYIDDRSLGRGGNWSEVDKYLSSTPFQERADNGLIQFEKR